eukprot:1675986-Pyramimonas_sp.AAC.1
MGTLVELHMCHRSHGAGTLVELHNASLTPGRAGCGVTNVSPLCLGGVTHMSPVEYTYAPGGRRARAAPPNRRTCGWGYTYVTRRVTHMSPVE